MPLSVERIFEMFMNKCNTNYITTPKNTNVSDYELVAFNIN